MLGLSTPAFGGGVLRKAGTIRVRISALACARHEVDGYLETHITNRMGQASASGKPSLEGGSAEGPSLEEDCGSSGGECVFIVLNRSRTKHPLQSPVRFPAEASLASGTQAAPGEAQDTSTLTPFQGSLRRGA